MEMAVLIGEPSVKLAAGITAVMGVDVASPDAPTGGAEELAIRG